MKVEVVVDARIDRPALFLFLPTVTRSWQLITGTIILVDHPFFFCWIPILTLPTLDSVNP